MNANIFTNKQGSLQLQKYLKDKMLTKPIKIREQQSIPMNAKEGQGKKLNPIEQQLHYMKTGPDEEDSDNESTNKRRKSSLNSKNNSLKKKNKVPDRLERKSIESTLSYKTINTKDEGKLLLDSSFSDSGQFSLSEKKNIQIPYEYLADIAENLHQEELKFRCNPNYMEKQKDINEKMRAVIVNWIVEVHHRFKLFNETLFLCVNLLDRFLSLKQVKRNKLQLVSIACLLVACKYEEIFSPEIRDFVCILDKSYDTNDIIIMERDLIKALNFDLTVPTSLKFFEILTIKLKLSQKEFYFGRYLLELSLIDLRFNKYDSSLIATSATYISLITLKKESENEKYPKMLFKTINYKEEEILPCVMDLCFVYENIEQSSYPSIRKKYLSKSFLEVAKIEI